LGGYAAWMALLIAVYYERAEARGLLGLSGVIA
jgi:hypothetical protein